jgi:hypothetical protein
MRPRIILVLLLIFQLFTLAEGALDKAPSEVVQVKEVLDKIEQGKSVQYDNVIIKGDLSLIGRDLPMRNANRTASERRLGASEYQKVSTSAIEITNSTIKGAVNFDNILFEKPIRFNNITFSGNVEFRWSQFSSYASFQGSQFKAPAEFWGSKFNKDAYFSMSQFSGPASFSGSKFIKGVYFSRSRFDEPIYFQGSQFNGTTYFGEAKFGSYAYFQGSQFNGTTYFGESQFSGNANFEESLFKGNTDFTGSQFNGYVSGWTSFKKSKFDKLAYLALINNFKNHGQLDDADNCYYQYRFQYMSNPLDYLGWLSCGFGVSWLNTIYLAIFMLISFGFLYFVGCWRERPSNAKFKQKVTESLALSAIALFSLPRELYPYGEERYIRLIGRNIMQIPFRLLIFFERLIGWALLILFIGTLSRIIIRY